VNYGLNEEEAAERMEERERSIQQFAHDQLGNSSSPTSDDEEPSPSSEISVTGGGWGIVRGPDRDMNLSELEWKKPVEDTEEGVQEQTHANECYIRVRRGIGEEDKITDARSAWSNTWAQAQAEARQIREMEERFSWMREADKGMLNTGLEQYPPGQFAEAIANSGETEFMVFEQRGNGAEVLRENCPDGAEVVVGATLVVRSRTCITVMNAVSHIVEAPPVTARLLTQMAECLPEGAQVDMVIASEGALTALGTCADILAQNLDIDQFCQDSDWKRLLEIWRIKQIQASCRREDAEGLDLENVHFLSLALQEVRQTVSETIQIWAEGLAMMDQ
jgi:hypothetical protein